MTDTARAAAYQPRGGDHRSPPFAYPPLAVDDPAVNRPCVVCNDRLLPSDIPTLIALAPTNVTEAAKKAAGKLHQSVAGTAHQDCAWPGEPRR